MPGLKENTIKLVLKKKMDSWFATITDQTLVTSLKEDAFITGGTIASMLLGEKINDYDVYFRTKETALKVAKYYINVFNANEMINSKVRLYTPELRLETRKNIKNEEEERIIIFMQSSGVAAENQATYEYFEQLDEMASDEFMATLDPIGAAEEIIEESKKHKKDPFRPVFLSENAITLSDKMQLVVRFYGEPSDIHKNYDFAHTTNYFEYRNSNLVLDPEALSCLLTKTLIYNGSLYPLASIFRIRKFIARGWRITAGQLLKMVFQLNGVDLTDKEILREQLIGVDQAYMSQLLRAIENTEEKIDATYLSKLIDNIFE
jgi:hypothetical protein